MRQTFRRLKLHHGVTSPRVAVHVPKPWYWRPFVVAGLVALGYGLSILQVYLTNGLHGDNLTPEGKEILAQLVLTERQLQVERAARDSTAEEMAALQDEVLHLKEDVAFYNSILSDSETSGVLKLHSVKLEKGAGAGEYRYQVLLVQSGRHDRMVQGTLRLVLQGFQDGKSTSNSVEPAGQRNGIAVKFKYYQRLDGAFSVPAGMQAHSLLVELTEAGSKRGKLTQLVKLPE